MADSEAQPPLTIAGPTSFLTSILASSPPTTSAPRPLDLRDNINDGTPVLITQTLTRSDGIVISVVTLGNTPTSTTTTTATTTSTPLSTDDDDIVLTSSDIAAIVGSVVGFLVLCVLLWCLCIVQRRKFEGLYAEHDSGSSSFSESDSEVVQATVSVPRPVRPRSVHFQTSGPTRPRPPPPPVLNVTTTQYGRVSVGGPQRVVRR